MGGISKNIGGPILDSLVCTGSGLYSASNLSSLTQYTLQWQIQTYASTWGYDRNEVKYYIQKSTPQEINKTIKKNYTDVVIPPVTSSYLGLLIEAPQYYMGSGKAHSTKSLFNLETQSTVAEAKSFLNIHEIPCHNHNGILSNESPTDMHYYPGYQRCFLGKLEFNESTSVYYPVGTVMTGAQIDNRSSVITDGGNYAHYQVQLVNKNKSSLFLGENDTLYNWPAIKYFGLFQKAADYDNVNIYATSRQYATDFYYIEKTPDLYLWGELNVADNWYHVTTDSDRVAGKVYYTRSGSAGNYTWPVYTGEHLTPGVTYYEQLGIIVAPEEGAVFSPNKFSLILEDQGW